MKLGQAAFMGDAVPGNVTRSLFKTPEGKQYWTSPKALLASGLAHEPLEAFEPYLLHGAAISGLFALAMLGWAWFSSTRTARGLGPNQFLVGDRSGTDRRARRALGRP